MLTLTSSIPNLGSFTFSVSGLTNPGLAVATGAFVIRSYQQDAASAGGFRFMENSDVTLTVTPLPGTLTAGKDFKVCWKSYSEYVSSCIGGRLKHDSSVLFDFDSCSPSKWLYLGDSAKVEQLRNFLLNVPVIHLSVYLTQFSRVLSSNSKLWNRLILWRTFPVEAWTVNSLKAQQQMFSRSPCQLILPLLLQQALH